ncbi:bifunctional transcriptional activator/DNA repair enzyme AdaA [Enterococcus faecalis]|uniref:bifunctional transcriptional activator/DNA repair enzyme AdaA n=1 Tax=Enterococcus faecalis TaxID=1351 RepID=UPI00139063C3|nr:bifunctional transcriptional activator/DNA repair enzyme AdaA [Enterococcus faecalis]
MKKTGGVLTMKTTYRLTQKRWEAIQNNNTQFDGDFFYGVTTTKIFCRPSCPSRVPNKNHVLIFKTAQEALTLGFRPCKRCQPTGQVVPNEEWVAQIKQFIDRHSAEPLRLDYLAQTCHGSPFHLQRTFKEQTKQTPLAYLTSVRIRQAQELLLHSPLTIQQIAKKVGFQTAAYFATTFKKETGVTPSVYRSKNEPKK